jgi:hypothetical protein
MVTELIKAWACRLPSTHHTLLYESLRLILKMARAGHHAAVEPVVELCEKIASGTTAPARTHSSQLFDVLP